MAAEVEVLIELMTVPLWDSILGAVEANDLLVCQVEKKARSVSVLKMGAVEVSEARLEIVELVEEALGVEVQRLSRFGASRHQILSQHLAIRWEPELVEQSDLMC